MFGAQVSLDVTNGATVELSGTSIAAGSSLAVTGANTAVSLESCTVDAACLGTVGDGSFAGQVWSEQTSTLDAILAGHGVSSR